MHAKAKLPVLVPPEYCTEIEALSKAALMDMVWSLAGQTVESCDDDPDVMRKIRDERRIVEHFRKNAQSLSQQDKLQPKLSARQREFLKSVAAANSLGRHLVLYRNDRAAHSRLERLGFIIFDRNQGEYRITESGRDALQLSE